MSSGYNGSSRSYNGYAPRSYDGARNSGASNGSYTSSSSRFGGHGGGSGGGGYGGGVYSGAGGGGYGGSSYSGGRSGGYGAAGYAGGAPFDRMSNLGDHLHAVDWDKVKLPPVTKSFYTPAKSVVARTDAEVEAFRASKQMAVQGPHPPRPVQTFDEAGFPEPLTKALVGMGFSEPTPIQSQAWPIALSGHDLVAIAETGSGKTIGFALPAIVHAHDQPPVQPGDGPIALFLAPTRELANQIQGECDKFKAASRLHTVAVYGGVPKGQQIRELARGADIVVATPGRLIDVLEQEKTNLRRVTYVVMDEADRMLDMGFEPQIRKVLSQIRPDRQTLMFSATWPRDVQNLARDFLQQSYQVNIGSQELAANHNVAQIIEMVEEFGKRDQLVHHLERISEENSKVLVFVNTKRTADELTKFLRMDAWPALTIHGDKQQNERDWVLAQFKSGDSPVLIATAVASRGLDVKDIGYVINYDLPNNIEDYVHQIGRTGRAGAKGTAITFFSMANAKSARDLIKILREAHQAVPPELQALAPEVNFGGGGGRWRGGRGGGRGGGAGGGYGRGPPRSGPKAYSGRPSRW